ncbi:MAG TPA: DUF393 domain-containing protein [Terriglobales bacterium]|nr:DUF393 domain-containing protein [Terriglobales bacterium]
MISLASEMTDGKGRHARGWLFFDADCQFCTRIARCLQRPMKRQGLALAPLQDPRVAALLGIPPHELLRAIRFVSDEGKHYAGADALLAVMRELPWSRPFVWLARIPGVLWLMRFAYQWIAEHRNCHAPICSLDNAGSRS